MISFIAWGIVMLLIYLCIYRFFRYKEKVNSIVDNEGIIDLRDIILFSTYESARYIKKCLVKCEGTARLMENDGEYVLFSYNNSYEDVLRKINDVHTHLLQRSREGNEKSVMRNDIDDLILDIWIKYGNRKSYRELLKREIKYLFENEYIIKSLYVDTYNRVFKFQ